MVVSQQVEVVEVVASSRDFLALQCSWRGSGLINLKISLKSIKELWLCRVSDPDPVGFGVFAWIRNQNPD